MMDGVVPDLGWFMPMDMPGMTMMPQAPLQPPPQMMHQQAAPKKKVPVDPKYHVDDDDVVSNGSSDDEHLNDYHIDGYHPCHIK